MTLWDAPTFVCRCVEVLNEGGVPGKAQVAPGEGRVGGPPVRGLSLGADGGGGLVGRRGPEHGRQEGQREERHHGHVGGHVCCYVTAYQEDMRSNWGLGCSGLKVGPGGWGRGGGH